jgi:hypothetical protein
MNDAKVARMEYDMKRISDRVDILDEKVLGIAQVCAAVADDMLRACFVLEEMSNAGLLPNPLPWNLGTRLVELQHALQAQSSQEKTENGEPIEQRVQRLKEEVTQLRRELARNNHG